MCSDEKAVFRADNRVSVNSTLTTHTQQWNSPGVFFIYFFFHMVLSNTLAGQKLRHVTHHHHAQCVSHFLHILGVPDTITHR